MKFYGKKGTPYAIHFCICPWVQISLAAYLFERWAMRNRCLATEKTLKARGFDLSEKMRVCACSYNDRAELANIRKLVGESV